MAATAAVGLMAVGTAAQAIGQYQQGQAQKAIGEYNARVSEQSAIQATQQAAYDELRHRERIRRVMGSQRTKYAASGVTFSGTPGDVFEDTTVQGELDALIIRRRGLIEKTRHINEATQYRSQGKAAARAATTQAIGTLVTGAASAGSTGSSLGVF